MRYIMCLLLVLSGPVAAHSWTPTYPDLEPSFVDGIYVAEMELWNSRADVNYFTFEVFYDEWAHVPWAAQERNAAIKYLERKKINIYIRQGDLPRVRYICSRSLHVKSNETASLVSSRICSKIK